MRITWKALTNRIASLFGKSTLGTEAGVTVSTVPRTQDLSSANSVEGGFKAPRTGVAFTGSWKPVTAGERLVFFLAANADCFSQAPLTPHDTLNGIPRGLAFRDFVHGCLLFHSFARLTQVAKFYRNECLDDQSQAITEIRRFTVEQLSLAPGACDNFEDLPRLALDCALAASPSSSSPSKRVKRQVLLACNEVYRCYSCDAVLDPQQTDTKASNYLSYDHLWPHSQGGDSTADNLMVGCPYCNNDKSDALLWQWHLIQALVPVTTIGSVSLESGIERSQKMAPHSQAAVSYARQFGTTLKEAYLAIGPRLPTVSLIDPEDTPDFFNLRVHDASRFAPIGYG